MAVEFENNAGTTWHRGVDFPSWMEVPGLVTLDNGYLLPDESPKDAMWRIARRAGEILSMPQMVDPLFDAIWKGWICPSTPIWCNFGTPRALPISCFSIEIGDSISDIYSGVSEIAKMTQMGGGVAGYAGNIRPRGSKITGGGTTNGPKAFAEPFDTTINIVTQGKSRRGSMAWYLDFSHPDFDEHMQIKDLGDPIQNLFPGVCISEADVEAIYAGEDWALERWARLLEVKNKTGLPYIYWTANANAHSSTPFWYGDGTDYSLKASNLCTEIMLPTSPDESFVCCLASMNVAKWDEWKDTKAVRGAVYLLEAVMQEFIDKTEGVVEMERARKFAERHRALGLGILGFHTYLQSKNQPYIGIFAKSIIRQVWGSMQEKATRASEKLADKYGNCPVIEEYNQENGTDFKGRHTTLFAQAPTVSNSTIQAVLPSFDAMPGNYYNQRAAKGNFNIQNKFLTKILEEKYDRNDVETWDSIKKNSGSVQQFDWMDEDDKEVFLTASEINQFELVRQAALMQEFVDQGISLNLTIPPDTDPKIVSSLYLLGYELGIKSFYYQRSENVLRKGVMTMDAAACTTCEG